MIIEKKTEIEVLRNFCAHPFDYFSVAEISKEVIVSRNWVYKIINKFEKFKILEKSGKKYKLDFSNLFCKRLKLLFDAEYLNSLEKDIFDIVNKLIYQISPKSLVLVGSVALNKQKDGSDIDFLAIGEKTKLPYSEKCNVILLEENEFKEKYLKGDDFIISSLIFGRIVYDENFFVKFLESPPPIFSSEIIQEKIEYCEKLENRVYTLLRVGEEKAQEELLYLSLQVGRIILLKNKIIPKTKYDIPRQVAIFDREIAKITEQLLEKERLNREKMLEYITACMRAIR